MRTCMTETDVGWESALAPWGLTDTNAMQQHIRSSTSSGTRTAQREPPVDAAEMAHGAVD